MHLDPHPYDPADPAWLDEVRIDERAWQRHPAARVGLVLGAFLIGMLALWAADQLRASEAATTEPRGTAPAVAPAPVGTGADAAVVPPPLDQVAGVPGSKQPAAGEGAGAATAAVRPASSGWAPVAATRTGSESGRLRGDLAGIAPMLRDRLDTLALRIGSPIEIISGWRTHREQADLYRQFRQGTGNLAAVPGTSRHEAGLAADVYIDGVALASVDGVLEQARALGLHFPVPGEPWHIELVGIDA